MLPRLRSQNDAGASLCSSSCFALTQAEPKVRALRPGPTSSRCFLYGLYCGVAPLGAYSYRLVYGLYCGCSAAAKLGSPIRSTMSYEGPTWDPGQKAPAP